MATQHCRSDKTYGIARALVMSGFLDEVIPVLKDRGIVVTALITPRDVHDWEPRLRSELVALQFGGLMSRSTFSGFQSRRPSTTHRVSSTC
eukprot:m.17770 g.17770  ORF g.17770 m.17770 type:complete len:91 (+) comp5220_c0_seq1:147-419(+)